MITAILGMKSPVAGLSLVDVIAGAAVKSITEPLLAATPVGNANFMSGIVKLGLAFGVNKFAPAGIIRNAGSIGLGVDGAEDLVQAAKSMIGGGAAKQENAW
jgi:hypothetical protein